jgi:hypothetical protein
MGSVDSSLTLSGILVVATIGTILLESASKLDSMIDKLGAVSFIQANRIIYHRCAKRVKPASIALCTLSILLFLKTQAGMAQQ